MSFAGLSLEFAFAAEPSVRFRQALYPRSQTATHQPRRGSPEMRHATRTARPDRRTRTARDSKPLPGCGSKAPSLPVNRTAGEAERTDPAGPSDPIPPAANVGSKTPPE